MPIKEDKSEEKDLCQTKAQSYQTRQFKSNEKWKEVFKGK